MFQWLNRVEAFKKSTGLMLMNMRDELRQDDIQWGRNEAKAVAKQMRQEGELTQEQMEKFLKRMERLNQSQKKKE